ncbi:hypothetical protein JNUCC0626_47735 [Lentzea sp. JNUCC 0626]|uniref:hypothetical protein n=1 Tax=Lentzea sp. JNUCC 0626 TaxID=3367513 RepID=UPI00374898DC
MRAVVAWWDLHGTGQTVASLREHLRREGAHAWAAIAGLHHKFWISDSADERWGAVMVWESAEAAEAARERGLPPNRASELIGGPPTLRLLFEVEGAVTGLPANSTSEEQGWL